MTFGAAPDAVVSSARRNDNANWAEVISKGEALLDTGIIRNARVAGLNFGKDQIISAMKEMSGISQRGDSLVLDLKVAASVVMPPLRSVNAEPGRTVLSPDLSSALHPHPLAQGEAPSRGIAGL